MTDLGGKIPGYIKDKVAQSQPMDLARLRKIAEAEHPQLLAQLDPAAIRTATSTLFFCVVFLLFFLLYATPTRAVCHTLLSARAYWM